METGGGRGYLHSGADALVLHQAAPTGLLADSQIHTVYKTTRP